ncbi:hypothetical protein PVOR_11850 [Paenibacillus vortex V453]|uniref:Uncharacterized protein n=1 Tax=Paenibacillus vortex V453 TaxID=715225 RepID=A0A2R9SWA6_9BACL|nr:hypothetical protein B9D94_19960 [Paenibacillus sp. Cedars]EFU41634.1 hypothetical protein PVOR_11850 [Paenibacillus vortex V453]
MNHQLQKHLPEAIETNKKLVSIITNIIDGLSAISEKYSKENRNHDNFMAYETELLTYTEFMRNKCHEFIEEIKKRNQ